MATIQINVPGSDDCDVQLTDTLEITFTETCRFCCPDGDVDYFSPALPTGDQDKGYVWTGTPQADANGKTVTHHSVGKQEDCSAGRKRSNRTISIGSQPPPE